MLMAWEGVVPLAQAAAVGLAAMRVWLGTRREPPQRQPSTAADLQRRHLRLLQGQGDGQ